MDSAILNQFNNSEKEVNSEAIKTKKSLRKKMLRIINEVEENDMIERRERLVACILSGNSKQYLGKEYTEQQINYINILI